MSGKQVQQLRAVPAGRQDSTLNTAGVYSGLFNVHKQKERYLLEIPDSLLNRDILLVSRISKSSAETRGINTGYAGDEINKKVIRFDKGPANKLFMRVISYAERSADSTRQMFKALNNSNAQAIAAAFEIKAHSKNGKGQLIDITEFIGGDSELLYFDSQTKSGLKLSGFQNDKSYIQSVKSYPRNVEIKTLKTYSKIQTGGIAGLSKPSTPVYATLELNTSLVLLPAVPMRSRTFDQRVGYFTTDYTDYDANPQGVEKTQIIDRWRLEPKKEDEARYLAGELVEPKKQIVFYIDPATPKAWVPYLTQGVNDWNVAFEQAGFKNAIVAKPAPSYVQDSTWSIDDARNSAIVYKASETPNASGPHISDPRTGEILESHVNWYHNVMKMLRNMYFIQASAIDPGARKMQFDEKQMEQLIRFVSSHEVGHTLGLRHNFGSSSTVPVDKLRDKAWVEANGHTPSIMDYARFNYVAQPEDGISEKGIFPRINDYDKWAIEWAYRWYPADRFKSPEEEKAYLNKWVIEKTSGNKRLWFGSEEGNDPRSQSEDLGDNAMLAGTYGIKNLKRIMPNLISWTKTENEGYENTAEMYNVLLAQFKLYMGHVLANVAGVMTTPKTSEENGAVVVYVSKAKQKQAVAFLQRQLFDTPEWLLNKEVFAKTGLGNAATISTLQDEALTRLMGSNTLNKLNDFEAYSPASAYTMQNLLDDLQRGIFSELGSGKTITIYRRNLQKAYLDKLMTLLADAKGAPAGSGPGAEVKLTDISSVVRLQLQGLQQQIRSGNSRAKDKLSKAHLQDLNQRITQFLKVK
ncbi:hypothetical protein HDC92_000015 [Pedobacter sp. AK017]|uniref:zinc-dependent metalloprotease n=1 Tax=Pedobacter sp. AK017 TaxID=2723073 RepID=UPI0017DAE15B|nr:zinc-dependent metalloprotease [Pedobacter sp. AK017]MBB5436351.1 hypothetical protein [Pedobacter sp. AK017]